MSLLKGVKKISVRTVRLWVFDIFLSNILLDLVELRSINMYDLVELRSINTYDLLIFYLYYSLHIKD